MQVITSSLVATQLAAFLHHEITLAALVAWAEEAMQEGEFAAEHFESIREVISRLGVADVRAFGLTWEDCQQLLDQLGYTARIEVVAQ